MPRRRASSATSRRPSSRPRPSSGCRWPAVTTPSRVNGRGSTGRPPKVRWVRKPDLRGARRWLNADVLSIEEISDRLEIQDLLVAYSTAIDGRRFDDLDRVFTADAYIDYRAMGGVDGHYPEVKAWLAQVLPNFP